MADNTKSESIGLPVEISIKVSAKIVTQRTGKHFRVFAIITTQCGSEEPMERMMLPGPYYGPRYGQQLKGFKARWRSRLDWIGRSIAAPALSLADSLVVQAYHVDEGVNTESTERMLRYTRRQAELFRELLPARERFWSEARSQGLANREGIWPGLLEAFDATVERARPLQTPKPKYKYKPWQIALVHAALDAGVMPRGYGILDLRHYRTIKRELIDRKG